MSRRGRWPELWPLAALLVTALYVFWTPPLAAITLKLIPIVFALTFVAAFAGLGAPVVRLLLPNASRSDQILISTAVGAGLTGAFTFLPGLIGIVNPSLYAAWTLLGLAMFGWYAIRHWRHGLPGRAFGGALSAVAAAIIGINLLQLLPMLVSPVVSTDAMEYHLMIPQIILSNGQIFPLPSLVESNYPSLAPYIYLLVMPLAGDVACKALHFWAGIGLLGAIALLVKRIAPNSNRLLAPALYLSMPVAVCIFGWAWNDNLFVLFVLLALGQILDYHEDPEHRGAVRHLLVAGILLGLAAWTKYTIVMVLLALAPLFLLSIWRWRWKWRHLIVLAAPIGIISLLVFVKNWAFTGNPFYPFLHRLFPSPYWSDVSTTYFHEALRRWEIADWKWHTVVTFPYHLVLRPLLIDVHTGIFPLVAFPFVFMRSVSRGQTFLKAFLVCFLLSWYLIQTETRSLLALLAVLFVVASPNLESAVFAPALRRRPALLTLVVGALASLAITVVSTSIMTQSIEYFFGLETRRQFLVREAEAYPILDWLNTQDEVATTVLVGLKRPYYATKAILFSAFADPPIAQALTGGEGAADDLVLRLRGIGVTHIVVDFDEYEQDHAECLYSWDDSRREVFEEVLATHCRSVMQFGSTTIYRLAEN
ncbi:MAG: glycosyltransferase family 39 protein [Thermoanaerobaculales bacterium]|nr:glycosyltransferase family 39 protein [Thermoanaerobaculales bacterium]